MQHQDHQHPGPMDYRASGRRIGIYTLGRFSLVIEGQPVDDSVLGKPLEFLKALVAQGGRDVDETLLNEALWPDSEGDQAHSAFTTTLSRLRKLMGSDSLLLRSGKLSLNDQLCWVDSWSFERLLGWLEERLTRNESQSAKDHDLEVAVGQIFALYHGPFLARDKASAWLLPMRERLGSKFVRAIRSLIRFRIERGGACHDVIALYEKARELEPCSEEFCRGLMRCHAARGNRPQALAVFDACNRLLQEAFGIQPSKQTQQLYRSIRRDDALQPCQLCSQEAN